ncbi:TerB family tellurite resistance protein [Rubrivirga sp.]|uniref:TerB family tellurite resistance protein n=1 Tax=Rubrivirga sp. TaxID=1885344 RepID=UPI003C7379EE
MDTPSPLADLALLALVVAHGTDGALDPRETHEMVHQLDVMSGWLEEAHSSSDLSALVQQAVRAYGDVRVVGLDDVVARVRDTLSLDDRARAHASLVEVADADGTLHTMEKTFLRHVAEAWGLD